MKKERKEGMPMKILVVDDDREIVELLTIYLKNESYEIVKAYDGKQASIIQIMILCGPSSTYCSAHTKKS